MLTSLQNPKVKKAIALYDRRDRDREGLFIIEGYREIKRAADSGVVLKQLFVCPDFFLGVNEPDLIEQVRGMGAEIIPCAPQVFEKLSYRDRPDGLVGVSVQVQRKLVDLFPYLGRKGPPFILIAEGIEKPGNLGTILRSADAAGVDGVIVCDRCTDIYNPNVIRSSIGTLFTIPVVEAGSGETLLWLKEKKITAVAASPHATIDYTDAELAGPIAIVVGTEQLGLSDAWMDASDIKVRIPMHGVADSLNVASATTILLYEVLRQRRYLIGNRFLR